MSNKGFISPVVPLSIFGDSCDSSFDSSLKNIREDRCKPKLSKKKLNRKDLKRKYSNIIHFKRLFSHVVHPNEKLQVHPTGYKFNLNRNSKLFLKIAHGNRHRKGKCSSPSKFEEGDDQIDEPDPEAMNVRESPFKGQGNSAAVIEVTTISQENVSVESTSNTTTAKGTRSEQIFEKISEKASRYLPKRGSLGKLFGEKEPTITIYTIDKEMSKGKTTSSAVKHGHRGEREKFQDPELSDKLKKSRQVFPNENVVRMKSVGVQASPYPPFRLYFLPSDDWKDPDSKLKTFLRIISCQCSLAAIFILWLLLGALVLYLTESPLEIQQVSDMNESQSSLIVSLATDLRLLSEPEDPVWIETIEKYFDDHEKVILKAVNSGYLNEGELWSYSGSFLFVVSLLTILGFGSPVPISMSGKIFSVIFTFIGLPLHIILIINLGIIIGIKMHIAAKDMEVKFSELKRRIQHARRSDDETHEKEIWPEEMFSSDFYPPNWVKFFPYISIPAYYIFGLLIFGVARDMSFPDILLYPLDFTERGSLALTYGSTRFLYACFLEGTVLLISLNAFLICNSSSAGLVSTAIKLGLVSNSIE